VIKDIRNLISKIEYIGLDTQPLRDLYSFVRGGRLDLSKFKHILGTLRIQLAKTYQEGSEPIGIKLLLNQLNKTLNDELLETSQEARKEENHSNPELTNELLAAVRQLSTEVQSLRSNKQRVPIVKEDSTQKGIVEKQVFVDPMAAINIKDIKANVKIKANVGKNLADKLARLKELKKA